MIMIDHRLAEEMQKDRNEGMDIPEIAKKYNVSVASVNSWTTDPLYYEWDYWRQVILDACGKGRTDG